MQNYYIGKQTIKFFCMSCFNTTMKVAVSKVIIEDLFWTNNEKNLTSIKKPLTGLLRLIVKKRVVCQTQFEFKKTTCLAFFSL